MKERETKEGRVKMMSEMGKRGINGTPWFCLYPRPTETAVTPDRPPSRGSRDQSELTQKNSQALTGGILPHNACSVAQDRQPES